DHRGCIAKEKVAVQDEGRRTRPTVRAPSRNPSDQRAGRRDRGTLHSGQDPDRLPSSGSGLVAHYRSSVLSRTLPPPPAAAHEPWRHARGGLGAPRPANSRSYLAGPMAPQRYASVVGVKLITPIAAAVATSVSENSCCGMFGGRKVIWTSCQSGLKPSPWMA